jgi:L-ascorbate metabolism protein UlaG (beta-lactamase superfamily)
MSARFANPDPAHGPHGMGAILRWGVFDRLLGRRRIEPPGPPAPRVAPDLDAIRDLDGPPRLTWIGHASFLGSLGGGAFVVDPHFSDHAGVIYKRHVAPGLRPADLPRLDALLVSHSHYDHLDDAAARALPKELQVIVPLGLGRWFRRRGYSRVRELEWWESAVAGPLTVTLVPSRHWSRRFVGDVNRTLWGGFVVQASGVSLYHAGDSAWFDGFAEIGRRFPRLLAAMLPVGSYSPAWFMEHHHLNPEQAGRAFVELGAKHLVPMHWGAFKLTDEPLCEPVERMRAWWRDAGLDGERELQVMAVGQTVVLDG